MVLINILIVDDEKLIVKGLKNSLEQQGYIVFAAYNGADAQRIIKEQEIDFIILDLMLPDTDGMMLAKDGDYDKILGFEFGADDYMTKPFNTLELIARIKAITNRSKRFQDNRNNNLSIGNLIINFNERKVYINNKEIELTAKEFDMLYLMAKSAGRVYTRDDIFKLVWEEEAFDVRTIDVHIRNLREKIEDNPKEPELIITKWGVGYYFNKS